MSRDSHETEPWPRVFVSGLIQLGDIVVTTTPDPISQTIRKVTGADVSHAMICVSTSTASINTRRGDSVLVLQVPALPRR